MTNEEKDLLLKDLCARLPYGVKVKVIEEGVLKYDSEIGVIKGKEHVDNEVFIIQCKNDSWCLTAISEFIPYLRPMSSMTEEEKAIYSNYKIVVRGLGIMFEHNLDCVTEWLLKHHFDYRGLIEKGLALEAPEGMYND